MKPKTRQLRREYLASLAIELEGEDGVSAASHLKSLMHRELQRNTFRHIKTAEKKLRGGGVHVVEKVINDQTIKIYEKTNVENEIIRVNKEKLLQANNTPLRESPLQELLGEQGDFERWEEILHDLVTLPDEGVEEGTRLWFEFMSRGVPDATDISWTTEEFFKSWKGMKEEKGSAPGWNFSHIKSVEGTSEAGQVISDLSLIPLLTGYIPEEWKIGINSMIPKKVHDLRPEKLRLILLMDCRFNHNNKLIGKKMMEYGGKKGILAKEQYGSRKHKSAIEHALNKRLVLDIIKQRKIPSIYCANDAKSCYDRIIMMVAYLTMRKFGIPRLAAMSSVTTLLEMKHYVRTVYGISKTYYGGEKWTLEGNKPHGNGEGNGNGPALWAGISSPLLNILRELDYGIRFSSPISNEELRLSAFGFVDDMDFVQTARDGDSNLDVFQKTKKGVRLWEELLRVTGGAIETSDTKTDWVNIDFEWKNEKWNMKPKDDQMVIHVRNHTGNEVEIKQLEPSTARETLGVMQSITGDEQPQVEK